MTRRHLFIVLLCIVLTACNLPIANGETPPPLATLEAGTPQLADSTPTRNPLIPPTPTFTSTPSLSLVFPKAQPVNCRSGPGTTYTVMTELQPGKSAELVGKNIDVSWWYVKNPNDPSTFCWLAADFVTTEGNVELLPVVNPPDIAVTAVEVSVEPAGLNVACDAFPQLVTVNVRITVNGPAVVTWHWEEQSTGEISPDKTAFFDAGGAKSITDSYLVKSARDYTMLVRTIAPNEKVGVATFKAVCVP